MARHRRIPTKKRNKLKSVDPFNRKTRGQNEIKAKKFNRPPKSDELDFQEIPRSMRQIAVLKQQVAVPSAEKRQNHRQRNKVAEASKKAGFKQRRFEGDSQFIHRLERATHEKVQEQLLKVRFDMAGRDPRAIDNELKEMDKQDAEKKKRKAAHRAALSEKKSKKKKKSVPSAEQKASASSDSDAESSQGVSSEQFSENAKEKEKVGKMDRKKRMRMLKAEETKSEQKELLLNAREVIPFGDRADAPPEFDSINRKTLKPGFSKAGSKQLLLKAMLNPPPVPAAEESSPPQSTKKVLDDERDRVIAAYRTFKKIRRQAQMMSSATGETDDS